MDTMVRSRDRRDWQGLILPRAAEFLEEAATAWTRRQQWYRLLSEHVVTYTSEEAAATAKGAEKRREVYSRFCRYAAAWQREYRMARTIDQGRSIDRDLAWHNPADGRRWLAEHWRRYRDQGQEVSIFVGAEKATMREQLVEWFADYGFPRVLLRGYSSQPLADEAIDAVIEELETWDRPAVLIYAGDLDVDGDSIMTDFERRTTLAKVIRVAIIDDDIDPLSDLSIPAKRKHADRRRVEFRAHHCGFDRALEIEAMEPEQLRARYWAAIEPYWSERQFRSVMRSEVADRAQLDA
jgi:hypothetical protein